MSKSVLAAAALIAGAMYSQTPPRSGRAAIETPVNALRSPEVNADRTVTLRFRAPEATAVDVVGEVTMGKGPQRMTKGADGVWTATVGPLAPEIWSYNFRVQGHRHPRSVQPGNQTGAAGFSDRELCGSAGRFACVLRCASGAAR